jgi:hypothetical protein
MHSSADTDRTVRICTTGRERRTVFTGNFAAVALDMPVTEINGGIEKGLLAVLTHVDMSLRPHLHGSERHSL